MLLRLIGSVGADGGGRRATALPGGAAKGGGAAAAAGDADDVDLGPLAAPAAVSPLGLDYIGRLEHFDDDWCARALRATARRFDARRGGGGLWASSEDEPRARRAS